MKMFKALCLMAFAGSSIAQASPPLPRETVAAISAALPQCSGGWIEMSPRDEVTPADLAPRLSLLARPSAELDSKAGSDLYNIAIAMLAPATGAASWLSHRDPSLRCPARPKEAVALLQYLAGVEAAELRGPSNAFEWLGLAYETGASGRRDPLAARRYYLLYQLHSGYSREDRWSDGIDKSLIGNAERAGLRPFVDGLANSKGEGGAVRLAMAEAILPTDPVAARGLLRYLDNRTANRLFELEGQGRVAALSDADEIDFWAQATRTLFGYRQFAAHLIRKVSQSNGGTIPTSPERVPIGVLRPFLDRDEVATADSTHGPIPVRALVTPAGRVLWIEACQASPAQPMPIRNLNVLLDAARLYGLANLGRLPKLPVANSGGRPLYTWVILPGVHFKRSSEGKQVIDFVDLPPDRCTHSGIADAPPPPIVSRP